MPLDLPLDLRPDSFTPGLTHGLTHGLTREFMRLASRLNSTSPLKPTTSRFQPTGQALWQTSPATSLPPLRAGMTLFCDFDGPIVDVSARYYDTYRVALARTRRQFARQGQALQLTPLSKSRFWRLKQIRSPDTEIAERSGLSGDSVTVFLGQVRELVNHCPALLRRDVPQPQVSLALQQLRNRGITLVLVTLRCEAQVDDFLRKHQMKAAFAAVYGTQNTEAAYENYTDLKTSLLSRALAERGASVPGLSQSSWMVGDTEADVVAAQRLGIPAIALTCGIRSSAYLKRLQPDAIQSDLLMLAQTHTTPNAPLP
jgi:phosphoglycolate phosphatase